MGGGDGGGMGQTYLHTTGNQRATGRARHPRNRTSVARRRPTRTHLDTPDVLPKDAVAYTGAAQRPRPIEHTNKTMTGTNGPPCQLDRFATHNYGAGRTPHSRQYAATPPPLYSLPPLAPHKTKATPHRTHTESPLCSHKTHRLKMMLLPPTALKAVSALPSMAAMGNMATIAACGRGQPPQPPLTPHGAAPTV